jgi:kynurenine formamidase
MLLKQPQYHSLAIGVTFDEVYCKYFIDITPREYKLISIKRNEPKSSQSGCNVSEITIIPHCHGTHTEAKAHVDDYGATIDQIPPPLGVPCTVVSICSNRFDEIDETYPIHVDAGEQVISQTELKKKLLNVPKKYLQALVLRTLPNDESKKYRIYHDLNTYPFFTTEAIKYIRNLSVQHLLVDTPSIDRLKDNGKLPNHLSFWNRESESKNTQGPFYQQSTITELIYAPNLIKDGFYYLYLCYPMLKTDAVPSWPLLTSSELNKAI